MGVQIQGSDRKTIRAARLPRIMAARVGMVCVAGSLLFGLAACGGGTSENSHLSTSTSTSTSTAKATSTSNSSAPASATTAPLPVSTAPAQDGTSDYCAGPKNVSTQPPATLPSYPGADLHVSQNTDGNSLFGYCSSASVSDIASFYAQQLPGKGWSNVQTTTISFLQQITATQGSANLTVSVEPSATLSGTTEVLVVVLG